MKKIFYLFIVNCLLLIPSTRDCYAQPSITWNRLYDGGFNQDDFGNGICKMTDGNFLLGGETEYSRVTFIKIDQYGNVIWQINYTNRWCQAITATTDGGAVFVAGGNIAKLTSMGDTNWGYYYTAYNISNLFDVMQCSDGGYVTCGSANSYNSLFIMKVDSLGNFLWQKTIPYPGLHPRFVAVNETNSNDYIVAGRKYAINYNESVMARFGTNGQMKWMKSFSEGDSIGSGLRIIKQLPYYVVLCGAGYMKIDDSGNVITSKRVLKDYTYGIYDMQFITNNKFVMVTNNLATPPQVYTRIYIEDTLCNILDSQSVSFSSYVRLKKILLPGNGDMIFLGEAGYDTSEHWDFYALRCDSNLNFPPIGIKNISGTIPNQFQLYQNYPNPFNPVTTIKFDVPPLKGAGGMRVQIVIYDITGRVYAKLVDNEMIAGSYHVNWDASGFSSGIYFCKLKAGDFAETKKMILLK